MIRVLICDDQLVVRMGLRAILSTAAGIEVVGEARDGDEALALVAEAAPCETYVRRLIQGMKRDLEQGPMIAFFWRRRCLKAITGETYWPETRDAHPGECLHSDYWLRKQRECMERWHHSSHAK